MDDVKEGEIDWFNSELKTAKSHCIDWRKQAEESYDFFASDQWTTEDKNILEEKGRLPIVFNRVARTINAVSGLEVQNRQEVRYIPREIGDAGVNEVLTSAAKWVRDNCDAEDEESEAFQDTLISGMGWTETWMDYESDKEGQIRIDRIDPLDMLWDPKAKKRNLDDTKWRARFKKIPKAEFEALWPGKSSSTPEVDLESYTDRPHDADNAKFYENNSNPKSTDKTVTVVQFQWWEKETYRMVQQPDGKVIDFDEKRWEAVKVATEEAGLKTVKRQRKVYRQAFLNGSEILEEGPAPCKNGFSLNCVTGLRDRNNNTWFGIVELMKDPQRWANKWLSQIMYIISVNAKGGLLAEESAFKNVRKAEETWAQPDAITWLQNGGLEKVREKGQAEYPEGLDRLLQYALQSVNDVPGVNLELLGLADRQQAGVLEAQRKQSGLTILAVFFDALRRYRKEQGRVLIYFVREYISDGRLIRVLGNNGLEQYVPLVRDPDTTTYDVVVDDAPTSPNMKEKVFGILGQLVPQLLQAGVSIPPDILDYTPLPEAMVRKWKEHLQNQSKEPDPRVAMEQQKLEFDKQRVQAELQLEQEKAQVSIQIEQGKLASAHELEKQRLEMDKQKLAIESNLEQQKLLVKAELDNQKLEQEMTLKRQQAMAEIQLQRECEMATLELQRDKALTDTKIKSDQSRIETGGLAGEHASEITKVLKGLSDGLKVVSENSTKALQTAEKARKEDRADDKKERSMEKKEANLAMEKLLRELVSAITAPKEMIRDANGRAVGSRTVRH